MCPFLTAQSPDGEVVSVCFTHIGNCKLRVLIATTAAFLHNTHTHTTTHKRHTHNRVMAACSVIHVQSQIPPPSRVTSPVLGHVTLLYRLRALWFLFFVFVFFLNCISSVHSCTLQMLSIEAEMKTISSVQSCSGLF